MPVRRGRGFVSERRWCSVLRRVCVVAAVAFALPAGRAAAGTDLRWSTGPSLGTARSDLAVTTVRGGPDNNFVFAMGGAVAGGGASAVVEGAGSKNGFTW